VKLRRFFTLIAVAAVCSTLAASAAAGEQIGLTETTGGPFPERTYVLTLPAGQRLPTSAVKVTENGDGVVGLVVRPAARASGTILAIDASDSMRGLPIKSAVVAARAFAANRNVNQRLGILTFNSSTHVAVPLTGSQGAIDQALRREPQLQLQTHLYDAVAQGVAQIRAAGIAAGSVVVLSDGADVGTKPGSRGSAATLDQVVQSAKAAHVRIYTVGLRSKAFRPGPLQQLASETGGSFSPANSPKELKGIYDQLGLQLAQEYLVKYKSKVTPGQPVRVSLSVAGVGKTNTAYVAPKLPGPGALVHHTFWDSIWQSGLTMILIALLVPAFVAAAIVVPLRQRNSTVRARVSDYVSMPGQKRELDALVSRVFTGTERSLERTRWWQSFTDGLQFADVSIPPVQVVFGTVVVTLFVAWALSLIAAPLALCAVTVPLIVRGIVKGRIARKRRLFGDQLADNLDVLASGMRAGHSLVGALAVVVADAAEPSKSELQRVIADEQLGVPLEAALDRVVERMRSRDLEQVALVASVQSETGGNAAEVLDRVIETIRERQEVRRLIRTLTAQGRLARWIVSLLPILLLIGIAIISPSYLRPMFTHTGGLVALVLGGFMIAAGSVIIGKIVDIEV